MGYYLAKVKDMIRDSDILIEVVDARFPQETRNFELEYLAKRHGKKLLVVIAKADLVPEEFLKLAVKRIGAWLPVVYISARERHGTRNLFQKIRELRAHKSVVIGVFGYPNVGKSSLINALKGKHSAPTSLTPGFTKGVQLIRLESDVMLIDTPGVAPLRGKKNLFLKGAISLHKVRDPEEAVQNLLHALIKKGARETIEKHYGLDLREPEEFLTSFAKKYNYLIKGGRPDTRRAAEKIYHDWLKGKFVVYWF
jgi:hypothetical protein